MRAFVKDPDEVLDYSFDWSEWLSDGDIIVNSMWIVDGTDLDLSSDQLPSYDDTSTTVWLEGGTLGANYHLTNRITTADERIADRTVLIKVRPK